MTEKLEIWGLKITKKDKIVEILYPPYYNIDVNRKHGQVLIKNRS